TRPLRVGALRRARPPAAQPARAPPAARAADRDDLPGPDDEPEPGADDRPSDPGAARDALRHGPQGRLRARRRAPRPGRDSEPGRAALRLPAPVLRRDAAAGD